MMSVEMLSTGQNEKSSDRVREAGYRNSLLRLAALCRKGGLYYFLMKKSSTLSHWPL